MTDQEYINKLRAVIRSIKAEYEHGSKESLGAAILYAKAVADGPRE